MQIQPVNIKYSTFFKNVTLEYEENGYYKGSLLGVAYSEKARDKGRKFGFRLAAHPEGSTSLVPNLTPQERAMAEIVFPDHSFIELGDGENPLFPNQSSMFRLQRAVNQRKIKRLVGFDQSHELIYLAKRLGIDTWENPNAYLTLDKFGLLHEVQNIRDELRDFPIAPFGKGFTSSAEMVQHIMELLKMQKSAIVKFDGLSVPGDNAIIRIDAVDELSSLEKIVKEFDGELRGVVQLCVDGHDVLSITSELRKEMQEYKILEIHRQLQKGGLIADGARPLEQGKMRGLLLDKIWPGIIDIYRKHNVSGGENINVMVLPEIYRKIAAKLYGFDESEYILTPIDPNVRPQSGTKMAMLNFMRQTQQTLDLSTLGSFAYGTVKGDLTIINNPALLYLAAEMCSLTHGEGGNFAVVNMRKIHAKNQTNSEVKVMIGNRSEGDAEKKMHEFQRIISTNNAHTVFNEAKKRRIRYLHCNHLEGKDPSDLQTLFSESLSKVYTTPQTYRKAA